MRLVFFRFVTAGLMLLTFRAFAATDASVYGLVKSQLFIQTNSSAPVPLASNGFTFDALVYESGTNFVTNATVQPPSAPQQTLPVLTGGLARLYEQDFNLQSDLDNTYPTGGFFSLQIYTLTMYTVHDGMQTGTLTFGTSGVPGSYPSTPQISNFSAAQAIDTTAGFLLQWTIPGGKSQYVVQLTVIDAVSNTIYGSPPPGASNALTGTSNSIIIPPNTLPPGTNLTGILRVVAPAGGDTNSYPGAIGVAGFGMQVQFPMVMRPAPVHPTLSILSGKNFPFQVQFTGETNQNYHLQYTSNFASWTDLLVTNPTSTTNIYSDPASTNKGMRFYRVKVGP